MSNASKKKKVIIKVPVDAKNVLYIWSIGKNDKVGRHLNSGGELTYEVEKNYALQNKNRSRGRS